MGYKEAEGDHYMTEKYINVVIMFVNTILFVLTGLEGSFISAVKNEIKICI